jgi:hypothetical protein
MTINTINRTTLSSTYPVKSEVLQKQQNLNKKIDTIHNKLRNSSLTNNKLNEYRDKLTRLGEKIENKKLAFTHDECSLLHEKIVNAKKLINQTVQNAQEKSVEVDSPRSTDSSGYSSNSVDSALSTAHSVPSNLPVDEVTFHQNKIDEICKQLSFLSVMDRDERGILVNNLLSNIGAEVHSIKPTVSRIQELKTILNSLKKFGAFRSAAEYRLMNQQIKNLESIFSLKTSSSDNIK